MGKFINKKTKFEFLAEAWNSGVTDMDALVNLVQKGEEQGVLVVKGNQAKSKETYEKNISWYLGELERDGKIKGFLKAVGRPKKYD